MKIKAKLEYEADEWEITFIDFPNQIYEVFNVRTREKRCSLLLNLKLNLRDKYKNNYLVHL